MNLSKTYLVLVLFATMSVVKGQKIGNYVNNGSFEDYFISGVIYKIPYYWSAADSSKPFGELLTYPGHVPLNSYTYQWPVHGKNYLISLQYCPTCGVPRAYPKNRLKQQLEANKTYCVTFFVNLANEATHGIDAIGMYFSDSSIDTIKKCNDPITFLVPQIHNAANNIITDTLNWTKISGQFVANGTEKYMLFGNFQSDASTNKTLTNPTQLPTNFSDYLIDGISCIELNLPAYAGPDHVIVPGDSAFIGRDPDFAIDSGCVWFKLPNLTTAIDTISGLWVKPTVTTTYLVRQILDCSSEKWDTVVVYINPVGLERLKLITEELKLFPTPAKDHIELSIANEEWIKGFNKISIHNNLGQLMREEEIQFKDNRIIIKTDDLPKGVYSLRIKNNTNETITKRFIIGQ